MNQNATSMRLVSLRMRLMSGVRQSSKDASHRRSAAELDRSVAPRTTARAIPMEVVERMWNRIADVRDCTSRSPCETRSGSTAGVVGGPAARNRAGGGVGGGWYQHKMQKRSTQKRPTLRPPRLQSGKRQTESLAQIRD